MTDGKDDDIIDCMARMKGDGQAFAVATVVRTEELTAAKAGAKAVIRGDGSIVGWVGGGCAAGAVRKAAHEALTDGKTRLIRVRPGDMASEEEIAPRGMELHASGCPSRGITEVFIEPVLPRPSLVVVGGSPVAVAVAGLGRRSGYVLSVAALPGEQGAFDGADNRIEDFALQQLPRIDTSFIVVSTQGRRDREALIAALKTKAPYVAFVGSRKKADKLRADAAAAGVAPERLQVLRAPAGLDIGGITPEEIALSILAEMVQERRRGGVSERPAVQTEDEAPGHRPRAH